MNQRSSAHNHMQFLTAAPMHYWGGTTMWKSPSI